MLGQTRPQEHLPITALHMDTLTLPTDTFPQPGTEEAQPGWPAAQSEQVQQASHDLAHLVLARVDAINTSDGFVVATHDSQ